MPQVEHYIYTSYKVSNWEQAKKFYGETLGLGAPAFLSEGFG